MIYLFCLTKAKKLCPELVIVPTNFPKYTEVSRQVQKVFADYDPEFSAASLDEAYLDITDFLNAQQDAGKEMTASEAVEEMRAKIFEKTQLTASAGIAPNGWIASLKKLNPHHVIYVRFVQECWRKCVPTRTNRTVSLFWRAVRKQSTTSSRIYLFVKSVE